MIKQITKIAFVIVLSLTFFACSKENNLKNLENQIMTFDKFFEKVSTMDIKTNDENTIHISYEWNKKDNLIKVISSEEKEPSWGVAFESAFLENDKEFQKQLSKDKYQVSCSNGDSSWNKGCNGIKSCAKLIHNCLDSGGCAEICEMQMEYAPEIRTFFFDTEMI